jgi:SPP1 family predicted phage head-tail adaptor
MNPGKLNKLIVLQKKITNQDAELNPIETWLDIGTIWADVLSQTSSKYYKMATINSEIEAIFQIRYRKLDPHMRISFRQRQYEIIGIENVDENNVEILISCKAVV